ncbi:TolC family protein [Candidatus Enterovibrio escicola]|uniref:TolC family protein n=1 Tax=Candidatus Enterovibrio escicola TaxID=1927127 RepID=UPI00123825E2|nr:TolC family protein [Candidatus Enterovibrio escacola]
MINKVLNVLGYTVIAVLNQSAQAISIEQAWQAAKRYDPTYEQAQIGVKLGENNIMTSRSALLPSLTASTTSIWNKKKGTSNTYTASLNQTIWNSSLWSQMDQADANLVISQLRLSKVHNELVKRLITAYLAQASAQGDLELAQRKRDEGRKLLVITEQRFNAGKVKSIEVEDMRTNQLEEKTAILKAQSKLEDTRSELLALINQFPDHVDQIRGHSLAEPTMLVDSQQRWLELAKDNNPELLVAKQKVKVSEYDRDMAKGGYYPTLLGTIGYQNIDKSSAGEFNASLTLKVPIDLNGSTQAKVDTTLLNIRHTQQDQRKIEINIQKLVQKQFSQVSINWQQVLMAKELVDSRERVLKSKQTLYNAGMSEASNVIDAHNHLFSARNNLQINLYNYWQQRVDLLQTAGMLDDDTINLISVALTS